MRKVYILTLCCYPAFRRIHPLLFIMFSDKLVLNRYALYPCVSRVHPSFCTSSSINLLSFIHDSSMLVSLFNLISILECATFLMSHFIPFIVTEPVLILFSVSSSTSSSSFGCSSSSVHSRLMH